MTTPRSQHRIALSKPDGGKVSPIQYLQIGMVTVLFIHGTPYACRGETEAYYPDLQQFKRNGEEIASDEGSFLTPAKIAAINEFAKERSLLRVPPMEFDFMLAQGLMAQLRPLLRLDPPDAGKFQTTNQE